MRDLKPIWLMSPLSVSDTLPLDAELFDVVIFDEASQIPLEEAVPALFRAQAGDRRRRRDAAAADQLLLAPRRDEDELLERRGRRGPSSTTSTRDSFLNHAARNLPSTMLGWHYRSRVESLISFSNRGVLRGRAADRSRATGASSARAEIRRDGDGGAMATPARRAARAPDQLPPPRRTASTRAPQRRRGALHRAAGARAAPGQGAARASASSRSPRRSRARSRRALDRLADEDAEFRRALEAEYEREEDGQFVGLFVKNLENIQGDERDVIILSVCYGPDPNGQMLMNFGPINRRRREAAERRLLAREAAHGGRQLDPLAAITNEYNDGANCLRNYLQLRRGDVVGRRLGRRPRSLRLGAGRREREGFDHAADCRCAPRARTSISTSAIRSFRCNLGVRAATESRYRLGILLDDESHHRRAIDEVMQVQPSVLKGFGWSTITVLPRLVFQSQSRAPSNRNCARLNCPREHRAGGRALLRRPAPSARCAAPLLRPAALREAVEHG